MVKKGLEGLRAITLLRVSTTKQASLNHDNGRDIPEQRAIVNNFIEEKNLRLVHEIVEAGVSGWKNSVSQRDALNEIMDKAENKEFDVLVIYQADRLGRRAFEIPTYISELNQLGIRIFSSDGVEIKNEDENDELTTFLTYHFNDRESRKISRRATDYQIQMTKNGKWRGGGKDALGYGYDMVEIGEVNHKNRPIYSLVIDETKRHIVEQIFDMATSKNMGSQAIATYLNEQKIPAKSNTGWTYSVIHRMLTNPMYKGYLHMESKKKKIKVYSNKIDKLAIIPEHKWLETQIALQGRKNKKNGHRKGINSGKGLISGIAYCGHCGSKLSINSRTKTYKNQNGEVRKYYVVFYRCLSSISSGRIKCEGQTTYKQNNIDFRIEAELKDIIINMSKKNINLNDRNIYKNDSEILQNKISSYKITIVELSKTRENLKQKIIELFSKQESEKTDKDRLFEDMLAETISDTEKKISENKKLIEETEIEIQNLYLKRDADCDLKNDIGYWTENYLNMTMEEKKAIANRLLEKVEVHKDKLEITLKQNVLEYIKR